MNRFCLIFLVFIGHTWAGELSFDEITLVTEKVPSLQNVEDNKITGGLTIEIIKTLFERAELKANIKLFPWPRAYNKALNEPNTLIFSMIRNKEREDKFIWIGKLYSLKSNITVLANRNDIHINTLSDLAHYNIGATRGDYGEIYLKSQGLTEGQNLHLSVQHSNLWQKLFKGRVDAVFSNDVTAKSEMIFAGLSPYKTRKLFEFDQLKADLYLAANKLTDPRIIETLQHHFTALQQDGTIDEIIERWRPTFILASNQAL